MTNFLLCSMPISGNATCAVASAMGHAGEFLQGAIEKDGVRHSILVSIPAPELESRAQFTPDEGGELCVTPRWKTKCRSAFEVAWKSLSHASPSGCLQIESNIPVCRGLGSSTADCVAAIRTAAHALGRTLSEQQIARLAHRAEQNSDATMFDSHPVVFRHREGIAHRTLARSAPAFDLVIVESVRGARLVETDGLARPRYNQAEIREFDELLERLLRAHASADRQEIGRVSERSADINQRFHPMPGLLQVRAIARSLGAYGTAIAHSGDIQAMLFAPQGLTDELLKEVECELNRIGMQTWRSFRARERRMGATPRSSGTCEAAQEPSSSEE